MNLDPFQVSVGREMDRHIPGERRHPGDGELGTGQRSQDRWHFSSRAPVIPTESSTRRSALFGGSFGGTEGSVAMSTQAGIPGQGYSLICRLPSNRLLCCRLSVRLESVVLRYL